MALLSFLTGTAEDYRLLEQMNVAVTGRTSEMKEVACNIQRAMTDLNNKCTYESVKFISVMVHLVFEFYST